MAGGNFDDPQTLNGGRVEWPTGPLTLAANETPLWIQAWIVQASTGSAQTCWGAPQHNSFPPGRWIANLNQFNRGTFQPGFAVGIALVWTQIGPANTPRPAYFWWCGDPIRLA
jgi:hypothetical protein